LDQPASSFSIGVRFCCYMGSLMSSSETPAPTDPPDYGKSIWWLAHPQHHWDRIQQVLPKEVVTFESGSNFEDAPRSAVSFTDDQENAPADVFYLHGTMSMIGNRAQLDLFDSETWTGFNSHHHVTLITAFTGSCRAFAPLYRNAALFGDWDTAYKDTLAAFERYLEETPEPRPLILAGHSQGSMHLARLVKERVAADPAVLARVAAVYAPGAGLWCEDSPLPMEGAGVEGPSVSMWATVAPEAPLNRVLVTHMAKGKPLATDARVDTWGCQAGGGHGGALLRDEANKPTLYRGLIERTEVRDNLLRLHPAKGAEAAVAKLGGNDFHAYDVHLFWEDVREKVRKQVSAYIANRPTEQAGRL